MRYFEDLYSTYHYAYGDGPSEAAKAMAGTLAKGGRVVDAGCGYGRDCIFLAKEGYEVTGFDTSRRGIMLAQTWARDEKVEGTFLTRDLMENRLPEKSFDTILCVNMLEYMDARRRARAGHELWRLAADGAFLALMVHSTDDPDIDKGKDLGDNSREVFPGLVKHFFTNREIKSIVPDFKEVRMEVLTVTEQYPEETAHKYWLLIGQRP
jgi:SAM-dependent methyltransferase